MYGEGGQTRPLNGLRRYPVAVVWNGILSRARKEKYGIQNVPGHVANTQGERKGINWGQ